MMNLRMMCLYVVLIGGSEGKDLFVVYLCV